MVSAARCVEIEPALADVPLVGGSYSATDESGDAHKFTTELARLAAARGVGFRFGTTVEAIDVHGGDVAGLRCRDAQRRDRDDAR